MIAGSASPDAPTAAPALNGGFIVQHPRFSLLLVCLSIALGCSDSNGPTASSNAVGTYVATSFETTANGVTVDQFNEGVTLTITLSADSTTTGQLFVPAASDEPLSLAGTWSQHRDTVSFHGPVDTFLQRLPFHLASGALEGDGIVGPGRIRVTLTRRGGTS